MDKLTLGSVIKRARTVRHITQVALAERLGISEQYVNDIEHDRRTPTNPTMLDRIAFQLYLDPNIVYFAVGKIPPSLTAIPASEKQIEAAFKAMRDVLGIEDEG